MAGMIDRIIQNGITAVSASLVLAVPSLAQAPVGDRVEINGMQMYYEVSGAGDPLIVLHGAYMNIPTMGEIIPRLAETHRVKGGSTSASFGRL